MRKTYMSNTLVIALISVIMATGACRSSQRGKPSGSDPEGIKGNISISGAFALYPLTVKWADEFRRLHPGVSIDISAGGAGKGMADVLSGMVDMAMFSREVSPEETNKGAWKVAVAKDAVFATVNEKSPAIKELMGKGLTRDQFEYLFTLDMTGKWNDFEGISCIEKINVYTRSDACGAAAIWADFFNKSQEELKGVGVFGDPGMADAVKKDPYGVGYNNLVYVFDSRTKKVVDGLAIIPLDLNGNRKIDPEEDFYSSMDSAMAAIREGKYPSPPSRNLYLITRGNSTNPLVTSFLEYILEEGQVIIPEAGYVQLDRLTLENEKMKLKSVDQ